LKAKEPFDLKNFGDVVYSGFGEEAPEQVREWVEAWYRATA